MWKLKARRYSKLVKSHLVGPKTPALLSSSISKQFELTAGKYPDVKAVISHHQAASLTYSELFELSRNVAANLLEAGVKEGDRIGIYSANSLEWYIIQMASALANALFVTINPAYKIQDLKHCLNLTELNCLIASSAATPSRILDNVDQLFDNHSAPADFLNIKLADFPHLKKIFVISDGSQSSLSLEYPDFKSTLMKKKASKKFLDVVDYNILHQDPHQPVNIQFTSGTTGLPKGALLTHHNLLNNSYLVGHQMEYSAQDKICVSVPLYHCFGMGLGNLSALVHGSTVIYPNATFKASAVVEAIELYKATTVYGVPTMFIEMLKVAESRPYDFSSLSKGIIAGSLCPEVLLNKVRNQMNVHYFAVAYGMTETSPITFMTIKNDTVDKQTQTVGKILPHTEAKIIDENGETVDIGHKGEFVTRGYATMKGYYNDSKATEKSIKDGWMHSGDIALMDEDGYLHIVGRSKDIIIRGGENIAPKEIEDLVLHMENIENVQVIGVEDEKLGEEICAFIKLKHNDRPFNIRSVERFLRPKIAHYKIPKYVYLVDSLPITVTGKPQKFKMRQQWKSHIEEIGSAERYRVR